MLRKTIKSSVIIRGTGLHSGRQSTMKVMPAAAKTGICFHLRKGSEIIAIPVGLEQVVDTSNAVTIGNGVDQIQTIEHFMTALYSLGITDLNIEIDSVELPIMDGSAEPYLDALQSVGVLELEETIEPIKIQNPLWVVDGDKYLVILPNDELKITYSIDFDHPLLRGQNLSIELNAEKIKKEIIPARTFGFLRDVEALQSRGLALGGSLDNAIIFSETNFLNDSLRFEDECVRHKILDLIGDLYVIGRPIIGHIIASKAGHALDISMAKLIMSAYTGNEIKTYKSRRVPLFSRNKAYSYN